MASTFFSRLFYGLASVATAEAADDTSAAPHATPEDATPSSSPITQEESTTPPSLPETNDEASDKDATQTCCAAEEWVALSPVSRPSISGVVGEGDASSDPSLHSLCSSFADLGQSTHEPSHRASDVSLSRDSFSVISLPSTSLASSFADIAHSPHEQAQRTSDPVAHCSSPAIDLPPASSTSRMTRGTTTSTLPIADASVVSTPTPWRASHPPASHFPPGSSKKRATQEIHRARLEHAAHPAQLNHVHNRHVHATGSIPSHAPVHVPEGGLASFRTGQPMDRHLVVSRNPRLNYKPDMEELVHGLGSVLARFTPGREEDEHAATITNVRGMGGFRWLNQDKGVPAISVPDVLDSEAEVGKVGTDRELGTTVCLDHVAATLSPHKISVMEPLFHALSNPADIAGLDLVVCRNALIMLYRISGAGSIYPRDAFPVRIDAELVGNAVVFHTWKPSIDRSTWLRERYSNHQAHHDAVTTQIETKLDPNADAEQMVRYSFGGMECLVKFGVQAMIRGSKGDEGTIRDSEVAIAPLRNKEKIASSRSVRAGPYPHQKLSIRDSGHPAPSHDSLVAIKTRKRGQKLDWSLIYAQMVFGQVPRLHVAWHDDGDYSVAPPDTHLLKGERVKEVAAKHDKYVAGAAALLRQMVEVVRREADVSFVARTEGELVAYKRRVRLAPLSKYARGLLEKASA